MVGSGGDLQWREMDTQRGEYVLAYNGWVMNADPLVNFAGQGSQVSTTWSLAVHRSDVSV